MTDLAHLSFVVDSRPVEKGVQDIRRFGDESTKTGQKVDRAERTARAAFGGIGSSAEAMATQVGSSTARGFAQAEAAVERFNNVAHRGAGFNQMRGAIQNTSFQLQDMVVQFQAGTAASIVLAQQLPQLLGGFGAFAAMLGVTVGLMVPVVGKMADMEKVTGAAGESLGRLVAILPSITAAGEMMTSAMTAVAGNLDRIAIYAGTAAAIFAGKYVAGMVSAAVATGGLTAALTVLRGALIRTGIGVAVVAAGELVYRLVALSEAAGSTGEAFALVGDVAVEVWGRVRESAEALPLVFDAVGYAIQSAFTGAFAGVLAATRDLAQSIAGILNPIFAKIDGPVLEVDSWVGDAIAQLDELSASYANSASASMSLASDIGKAAAAPLGSVKALRDTMGDLKSEAIKFGSASEEANAKAARGAREAAKAEKDRLEERLRLEKELLTLQGNVGELRRRERESLDPANRELQDMVHRAQDASDAVGTVSDAFGNFVSRGLRDFKGFASDILGGFQRMLAQMVAMAARNKIMISMGLGGGVGGAGAAAAAPGGIMSGIGSALGGMAGGFGAGLGSVIGGLGSGGLAGGIGAIGTALSGATAGLSGLAVAAGALALPVAAAVGAFMFFRTKTKELDNGLRVTAQGAASLVEEFKKVEKSRFFGLSKRQSTDYGRADASAADPIQDAYREIYASISDMAAVLGIGGDALDGFTQRVSVSLKGLTEEQAQAEVEKVFGQLSDNLARAAMEGGRYIQGNETATEALARLTTSLSAANSAMETLGFSLYKVSLGGADAAASFVKDFGGLEQFAQATEFYFQKFYDIGERTKETQRQFSSAVDALESSLITYVPKTEKGFRYMVEKLMEAGHRRSAAALMQMAPLFVEMRTLQDELKGTEDAFAGAADAVAKDRQDRRRLTEELLATQGKTGMLRRRELWGLSEGNKAIQRRIWALDDATAAEQAAAEATQERAREAERIAAERSGIERQLLELQGKTSAVRAQDLAAIDSSNRGLMRRVYALQDATAAEEKAAAAAEERRRRAEAVASERSGIQRQILELQGQTAAVRRMELSELDSSNRALMRRVFALQDAAAAEERAAARAEERRQKAEAVANERTGIRRQILELQGETRAIRRMELSELDSSNRGLMRRVFALQDAAAAEERAAAKAEERRRRAEAVAGERTGIRRQILELQGETRALRRMELSELDRSNRSLMRRVYALQDAAAAEEKATAVLDERKGLERRLLELQGSTNALRRLDLLALNSSNRALLRQIFALEDMAEKAEKAAAVADERKGLEQQLLELQGNTAELRRRELAELAPANRALQRMVWGLQDAKEAMEALKPEDFVTLFDFRKAQGLAANGMGVAAPANTAAPIYTPGPTASAPIDDPSVIELRKVREEIAAMREEQRQLGMNVSTHTKGTRDMLRKFDATGMPAVRA